MEHPAPRKGWRGYLATWVWPWVAAAWAIPTVLILLLKALGQDWPRWLLAAPWVTAPMVAWWARGRGREPFIGFLALTWLWITSLAVLLRFVPIADTTATTAYQMLFLLSLLAYWPLWWWFHTLRKLPSASIAPADKLSIGIFAVVGTPGIAASMGGPDPVTLAAAFLITLWATAAIVMLGTKGPAYVQQELKSFLPRAVPWARLYTDPSVIVAVAFGGLTVSFLGPDLPGLPSEHPTIGSVVLGTLVLVGISWGYLGLVLLLQWLLLHPSRLETAEQRSDEAM